MKKIQIDKNQMEIINYGTLHFPFRVNHTRLSEYESREIYCHWHLEYEIIYIHTGSVYLKVNETETFLKKGEGIFINSNMLHMLRSADDKDCFYSVVGFTPSFLTGVDNSIKNQYVDSITDCASLDSFVLRRDVNWQKEMLLHIKKAEHLWFDQPDCYELKIISHILQFWCLFYEHIKEQLNEKRISSSKDTKLKSILTYLHNSYAEKITLDDIAKASGMSKSSCNHLFKAYMKESVFDYLLRYRIHKSLPFLIDSDMSITEISLSTGFSGSSYYAEVFKRYMYMTPGEYKKSIINIDSQKIKTV